MQDLKLRSVCSLIFIFFCIRRMNVSLAQKTAVHKVQKVTLLTSAPAHDELYKVTSFKMNLTDRQNLCKRMMYEVTLPVLPKKKNPYVPRAHLFEFVDYEGSKKTLPAIKCPTIPTLYLSHENDWSVRIWAPIRDYEFNFEVVEDAFVSLSESGNDDLKVLLHQLLVTRPNDSLYSFSIEERWWLCVEAQKLIQYKIHWGNTTHSFEPKGFTYVFDEYYKRTEVFSAYKCPTYPQMFIRVQPTRDAPHISKRDLVVITIVSSDRLYQNELP